MNRVTITTVGFRIVDKYDITLAYEEHCEDALHRLNRIEAAEYVRRVSDNALIAEKYRLRGPSFWTALWNDRGLA